MPYWEVDIWNLRSFQWLVWCNFFIFFHPIFEGLAKQQNYERWWLRCQIYSFYQFQSNVLLMLRPDKGIIIFIWSTCCHDKSYIHLESSNVLTTRQSAIKQYSYFVEPVTITVRLCRPMTAWLVLWTEQLPMIAAWSSTAGFGRKRDWTEVKMRMLTILAILCLTVNSVVEANLQAITEDNWRQILKGEWMVEL